MRFSSPAAGTHRALNTISDLLGSGLAWLSAAMVLITVTVVILRYGFGQGSIALQESVTYLHGLLFMLGASVGLRRNGHVRVDVFYRKFKPSTRAIIDLCGSLFFLIPFCLFAFLWSYDYVLASWHVLEGSADAGGIKGVYLLKSLIPVMALLLLIQAVAEILRCLLTLTGHAPPETKPSDEDFL